MKTNLNYMSYTQFKEHLDNKKIKYETTTYSDFPNDLAEVSPKSKSYKSRNFFSDTGEQRVIRNKSIAKPELDGMDYHNFIEFLKEKNVEYEEIKELVPCIGFYIRVKPKNKRYKIREFCSGLFEQYFGEDDRYNPF